MTKDSTAAIVARIDQKVDDLKEDLNEVKGEFKKMNGRLIQTTVSHNECKMAQARSWERQKVINAIAIFVMTSVAGGIIYALIKSTM